MGVEPPKGEDADGGSKKADTEESAGVVGEDHDDVATNLIPTTTPTKVPLFLFPDSRLLPAQRRMMATPASTTPTVIS